MPSRNNRNDLHHLNPDLSCLFQRPKSFNSNNFNPDTQQIWYVNCPVGESTLGNSVKTMSNKAEIIPHLTNHCIRATLATVLSEANCVKNTSDQSLGINLMLLLILTVVLHRSESMKKWPVTLPVL